MTARTERAPARRRLPARLVGRFLLLVLVIGAGFAALRWTPLADWLTVENLRALFDRLRESWWAPAALILAYVVFSPLWVPASVLMITGGVVFGLAWGSLYNFVGTFLGGAATYYLGRFLGRDFVLHLAGDRLKRAERVLARRGFWSLVGIRFVPLPYPLVNYCAALAGVRPGIFLATTAIGLLPTVVLFTYFADTLARAATTGAERGEVFFQLLGAALLLLGLTVFQQLWSLRQRRKRYQELLRVRRRRRERGG